MEFCCGIPLRFRVEPSSVVLCSSFDTRNLGRKNFAGGIGRAWLVPAASVSAVV